MLQRSGVLLSALTMALVVPGSSAAAEPLPWAPAPVNSCGEVGLDPQLRKPDPKAPPALPGPVLPPKFKIQYPSLELVPVPLPGPGPKTARVASPPITDPCVNPCPELAGGKARTEKLPPADVPPGAEQDRPQQPPPLFQLPTVELVPQHEPIPVPIPRLGPVNPGPKPRPPQANPVIAAGPVSAQAPAPKVRDVRPVSQLTGPGSPNRTDKRWQVFGTDLGLIWETKPGQVAVMFGDTFGKGWKPNEVAPPTADWRSNVLGFSSDRNLADGMSIDSMVSDERCHAVELLESRKLRNFETTTIPTSGFAVGNRQYVSYMSVRRWSYVPGMWWTNYGGIAYSDDGGQNWIKDDHAKWDSLFGFGQFQVAAMVPHGDFVYMFGTPNGRVGTIALARTPKTQVLNKTAYQYWQDGFWKPLAGVALTAGSPGGEFFASHIASGIASELSVRYDESSGRWQMSYLDPVRGAIVLRDAASPQGQWSEGSTLIETADYPKAYGGFIHPWSTGKDLYFTISEWDPYNVFLMHANVDSSTR